MGVTGEYTGAIVAEYTSGKAIAWIAKRYGFAFSTIRKCLITANIKIRPRGGGSADAVTVAKKAERRARCIELYAQGISIRAVGKELGYTGEAVAYHLRKAGVIRGRGRKCSSSP